MSERYRYPPRARSPALLNPGRISLPSNISTYPQIHEHHHVVPSSRREIIPAPRSSTSSVNNGGTITTTYKVKSDGPARGSSVRDTSRTRRSTLDNHNRPTVVTSSQKYRPVIHSSALIRPASPLKNNPFRTSEEEYVTVPASSRHGHHHSKRYSATMDNADMNRLTREREANRLHIAQVREPAYTSSRSRPVYTGVVTRHSDAISDDYGEDGYGYTNPRDLVQYDLAHNQQTQHRSRRDSFDSGRTSRPTSIGGYGDTPRSYETRERGPPPTTRGLDKIRAPVYDQALVRPPRPVSPPNSMAPMEPVQRPAPFEPVAPVRRTSTSRSRPTSLYHENREPRRALRDEYHEVRDDDRRDSRPHRHDNAVESRGSGVRNERSDRPERPDRPERSDWHDRTDRNDRIDKSERAERVERVERSDRNDRNDRNERNDRSNKHERPDTDRSDYKESKDSKEHKGRDALATGLSLAGAALGVTALKNAARGDNDERDDRDEREEKKKREYEEEPRRRREKNDRSPVNLGAREPKERRHRDEDIIPQVRDVPPSRDGQPRDGSSRNGSPREVTPLQAAFVDLNDRDAKDRKAPRDDRDKEPERRERWERYRDNSEAASNGTAIDSRSDSSASEEARTRPRREPPARSDSGTAPAAFNPKDTMDLFALKEALNSKEPKDSSKLATKEPISKPRTPRGSSTRNSREAAEIRENLVSDRRSRETFATNDNRQLRVVSPPREKVDDKPVKGILRQPKEKFPEDPAPIREGVAPLKDAKKDGIPPDARWTKISRKLVNPAALEAGKERFEAREDFVIVLRVLSKEEVQGYADVTQHLRSAREEQEEVEAADRRRARRERHERHKRERNGEIPRSERGERRHRRRTEQGRERHRESNSESDSTEDDEVYEKPRMLEAPQKRANFQDALMSGGLGELAQNQGSLRENPEMPGTYTGYTRNPPLPGSIAGSRS
ncbi:uncharacterized protein RSE6_00212 [Rhynchosporium secalis]|uniref:DUF8035 domain-containing protein n=1 Tax=Rhynchosporium secalis TaxID=38038 RepID=A0A1E1LUR0_RHYSE|nr:uncharacterized protein RSE6_00212 [Rhynchosporium secalis]